MKESKKLKVAIFDIDGTIFRSSLLIEIVEVLIQEKLFPVKTREIYSQAYKNWINRKDSYDKYMWKVVEAFYQNIKGISHNEFLKITKKIVNLRKDRVYRYTRDLVEELKKKDYYILAISHSPKVLVDEFCQHLGFSKSYGRLLEINKNGRYTGEVLQEEFINDKAKVLERAMIKENLTLKDSVGVGDSEGDIPFLKMVEAPICFNPNKKLYEHAKRAGWKIVAERKDVIYHI